MPSSATTRCGLLLSSAIAGGTLLGSPPPRTSRFFPPLAAGFLSGCSCFMVAGASLISCVVFAPACCGHSATLPVPALPLARFLIPPARFPARHGLPRAHPTRRAAGL